MTQIYIKSLFPVVCICLCITLTLAQVPSLGRCPEYQPMPDFDKEAFLGKWYEIERYFTVTELASRCVTMNYERRSDGKIWVNNEITNRFTNVQRIVSGVMSLSSKSGDGKFTIKYTTTPVNYDTTMYVLDTDYDSYAVLWSCSSIIGPVGHSQNVWVMGRERSPSGPILQRAYGVLDKYQISRTFFVKTDQNNCVTTAEAEEADENTNPGYDIVVDDEEVLNEYYNGVPAQNYYRENALKGDKKPDQEPQEVTTTKLPESEPATPQTLEQKESKEPTVAVPTSSP